MHMYYVSYARMVHSYIQKLDFLSDTRNRQQPLARLQGFGSERRYAKTGNGVEFSK